MREREEKTPKYFAPKKAVVFGAIVTFWPMFLIVVSSMICYSKWFQEEEENTKNFKAKYKLSNNPTVNLLEKIGS